MSLQERLAEFFRAPRAQGMVRADADDVARAVAKHCRRLGCDESNTLASVTWALRAPGSTFEAIRAGRQRAEQLLARQRPDSPPFLPRSA